MVSRGNQEKTRAIILAIRLALFYSLTPSLGAVVLFTYVMIRRNESVPNFELQSVFLGGCALLGVLTVTFHLASRLMEKFWPLNAQLPKTIWKNDVRAALTGILVWGLWVGVFMATFGFDILGSADFDLNTRLTSGFLMAIVGGSGFGVVMGRKLNPDRRNARGSQ